MASDERVDWVIVDLERRITEQAEQSEREIERIREMSVPFYESRARAEQARQALDELRSIEARAVQLRVEIAKLLDDDGDPGPVNGSDASGSGPGPVADATTIVAPGPEAPTEPAPELEVDPASDTEAEPTDEAGSDHEDSATAWLPRSPSPVGDWPVPKSIDTPFKLNRHLRHVAVAEQMIAAETAGRDIREYLCEQFTWVDSTAGAAIRDARLWLAKYPVDGLTVPVIERRKPGPAPGPKPAPVASGTTMVYLCSECDDQSGEFASFPELNGHTIRKHDRRPTVDERRPYPQTA